MKETIVKIEPSTAKNKKYTAFIKNQERIRKIHFGHSDYEQYKDSTKIGKYWRFLRYAPKTFLRRKLRLFVW